MRFVVPWHAAAAHLFKAGRVTLARWVGGSIKANRESASRPASEGSARGRWQTSVWSHWLTLPDPQVRLHLRWVRRWAVAVAVQGSALKDAESRPVHHCPNPWLPMQSPARPKWLEHLARLIVPEPWRSPKRSVSKPPTLLRWPNRWWHRPVTRQRGTPNSLRLAAKLSGFKSN